MNNNKFTPLSSEDRIAYYNKRILAMYDEASTAEDARREYLFDEIHILQTAVASLEEGSLPPSALPTKKYYLEPEDDGCAGGACKI